MEFNSRRIFVWLISLLAVVVMYKLYTMVSQTPVIDMDTSSSLLYDNEPNDAARGDEMGEVGNVEIGTVEKARFTDLNKKTGRLEREFGFERILHKEGKEWEIKKPYMNIYKPDFTCYITAEKGKVVIEDAVGRVSPSDATLTGNVVIHIIPEKTTDFAESFLYLDNIIYISEESRIATAGPVRFVSGNIRMNGKGLQLVYNDESNQLEFLRIVHLESLRLKSRETSLLSSEQRETKSTENTGLQDQKPPGEPIADQTAQENNSTPAATTKLLQGNFYKCIFNKNVVIETPEQFILADKISINNVLHSDKDNTSNQKKNPGEVNKASAKNTPAAKKNDTHKLSEDATEIIVTCNDGIVIIPTGFVNSSEYSSQMQFPSEKLDKKKTENLSGTKGRTICIASEIDYYVSTGDIIAAGPAELTLYVKNLMNTQTVVPAKIFAKEKMTFFRADNQVVFEGDCLCSMIRENKGIEQKYTLSAPKITVNLADEKKQSSDLSSRVKNIIADGGTVKLNTLKKAQGKLIGGVELKCARFNYDSDAQFALATGPGVIKVDNSNITEPTTDKLNKFSLRRRCYALVEHFDSLTYFLESNRIVADAESHQMSIGYAPIIENNKYGQPIRANAGRIDVYLYETMDGRLEISKLLATDGIACEQADTQFEGSEMLFDADESVIRAAGNNSRPCLLNGAAVDGIVYNLETGKIKTRIVAPGMFQMTR